MRPVFLWLATLLTATTALAQIEETAPKVERGPKLNQPLVSRYQLGVKVSAGGKDCQNIYVTAPVPTDWPEQKVKVVAEDFSPEVKSVTYRTVGGTVKQMVVDIPHITSGQTVHALITVEVTRYTLIAPDDTAVYSIPKKPDQKLQVYLAGSPYIEVADSKIKKLAKEVIVDKESDWEKVEAIYDWVTKNIKYENGKLKGAARALRDKTGDCEELSSLFIAMCRLNKIPARTVWVPEHCYSEFYLVDDEGHGHWFPCQSAGSRAFGGINEQRPVLQKGDSFKDPDRPRERMRYLSEYMTGKGGPPDFEFVRQVVGN
jgi:transglutaminase-like putative cysteine protease